jgi:hypothetical protein
LPPTAPPAMEPKPTNSACSCTPAPIGCCGRSAAPCQTLDLARHVVRHLAIGRS